MRQFDAVIIGAGQAGPALAARLTGAGMAVALAERKLFGGTCVNTGCTPTKALVASAYAAHLARRAVEKGETRGLLKVVVEAGTRRIPGAAILCTGGDEAIHGVLDMTSADGPYDVPGRAVPTHPTVSELIPAMLGEMRPAVPSV